jgi:hypothetical protein
MKLLFYGTYFLSLLFLYAPLCYMFGIKVALLVFGAITLSCFVLLGVLCWNDWRAPTVTIARREDRNPPTRAFDSL